MDAQAVVPTTVEQKSRIAQIAARVLPFVIFGATLFLLRKQLPAAAVALGKAHPVALWSLVFFFAWNHVATLAWRELLRAAGARVGRTRELVRIRIEAQAVNQVVPAAGVAGEALRAFRAAGGRDVAAASLATLLDNFAGVVAGVLFSVGAVSWHFLSHPGATPLRALFSGPGIALVVSVLTFSVALYLAPKWLPRLSLLSPFRDILGASRERWLAIQRALRNAVGFRFVERVIAVGEICVVFRAVGAPVSVGDATLVSAVLVMMSFVVFFSPGQIGAAEAATVATASLLGLPVALALSAALLRRARQWVVCLLGAGLLFLRRRKHDNDGVAGERRETT